MIQQHIHLPCPPAAFAVQNIEIQQNKYSYYYFSIIIFTTGIIIAIILVGVNVRNQFLRSQRDILFILLSVGGFWGGWGWVLH